jgi:hypothetical protein
VSLRACTLSRDGRARQRERFEIVRPAVAGVDRRPTALTVRFGAQVDEGVLAELVATERECCAFLDIAYDERVLRIGSGDPHDLDPFEAMLR